jgi:hypothetical protein
MLKKDREQWKSGKKLFCKNGHDLSITRIVDKNGYSHGCRICHNRILRKSNRKNAEKIKERRTIDKVKHKLAVLKYRYGLEKDPTINAKCEICGTKKFNGHGPHIDHDHKTKKFRGILCINCNVLLGNAKDNIDILRMAIIYLKKTTR